MAMVYLLVGKLSFLENCAFCVYPTPTHIYFMVLICFTIKHYSRKGHNMQTSNCHLSKRMPPSFVNQMFTITSSLISSQKTTAVNPSNIIGPLSRNSAKQLHATFALTHLISDFFALGFPFNISSVVYCAVVMAQIAATDKCQVSQC